MTPPPIHPVGAEEKKMFDFDDPRSLEKALLGNKNYFLLKSTKSTKTSSQKC